MTLHNLKLKSEYVIEVMFCEKTFELRKNDRDFKVGDYIHFTDTKGEELEYYENNVFKITYVLKDVTEYGLDKDYCILSIKRLYSRRPV